jgi:hypothetical protein
MAGGTSSPRDGRTVAERSARGGPGQQPMNMGRHCWLLDPPYGTWKTPGLLVEWRKNGDQWEGRVLYMAQLAGRPSLVEAWFPAYAMQPTDTRPPPSGHRTSSSVSTPSSAASSAS